MADNFLEKKLEEYNRGRTVIRRSTPSLETLLKRISHVQGKDRSYTAKQAQLDAIVRAASLTCHECGVKPVEAESAVVITCSDPVTLGEAILASRLKAAELNFSSEVKTECGSATITIFK